MLVMNIATLTPAPGCQDHTISPSAHSRSSRKLHTSTASRLDVRDDAYAPQ
jgi:hypothetical protein